MTREELLELAGLDALGLLDEYEAALYTRSFHHAPVAVQEEVRGLQAEIAGDPTLLPDAEPTVELRQRVLRAVARAIESESAQLAPLAMIGRTRAARREVVGRVGLGASGQVWRAAAFVLAGVLLVVLYFFGQRVERNQQVLSLAVDLLAKEQIRDHLAQELNEDIVGPDLLEFLNDPSAQRIVLRPTASAVEACAIVFINEDTDQAFLLTFGLPAGESYDLAVTHPSEGALVQRTFNPRSALSAMQLGQIPASLVAELTFTIASASGDVIMRA